MFSLYWSRKTSAFLLPLPIVLLYLLVRKDCNVVTAADGAKAIEVARSDKSDLIILDITLPV